MKNTMEKTNRNTFIDIIKGTAIFLMLWGHCIQYCYARSGLDFYENGVFRILQKNEERIALFCHAAMARYMIRVERGFLH